MNSLRPRSPPTENSDPHPSGPVRLGPSSFLELSEKEELPWQETRQRRGRAAQAEGLRGPLSAPQRPGATWPRRPRRGNPSTGTGPGDPGVEESIPWPRGRAPAVHAGSCSPPRLRDPLCQALPLLHPTPQRPASAAADGGMCLNSPQKPLRPS